MRGKILVVVQRTTVRSMVESILKEQGYEAVCFDRSQKALDWLGLSKVDLIILDSWLVEPETSAVCQKVRLEERLKNIPIIVLLSLEEMNQADQLKLAGASDVVAKPFNPRDLLEKVEIYLLEKAATSPGESTPVDQSRQPKSTGQLGQIFGSEEALDLDSVLSEGREPASADAIESLFGPGQEDKEELILDDSLNIELTSPWTGQGESQPGEQPGEHDYSWFLDEMAGEKTAEEQQRISGPAEPPQKPSQPQKSQPGLKVEEMGTSKVDTGKSADSELDAEPAAEVPAGPPEEEFNPQIVVEEENQLPAQAETKTRPSGSKEHETTRVMPSLSQGDYERMFDQLTSKLADRLAKELVAKLDSNEFIRLLKEEFDKPRKPTA
jgi:CheY-like chemotaxis protein